MLANFYEFLSDIPESRYKRCKMAGAGVGNAPTKTFGAGVKSITRVSAGDYQISYSENPGKYLDADFGLESATMVDLKNFSVIFKPLAVTASSWILEFTLFNATGTATDLLANQSLTVYADFAASGLPLL